MSREERAIRIERRLHVDLAFHLLAHLDLGADAASLFDPALPTRPWTETLAAAYQADPRRLAMHALPLVTPDLPAWLAALDARAGQPLATAMAVAARAELLRFGPVWRAGAVEARARRAAAQRDIAPRLERLREALWAESGAAPPPLALLDCAPLGAHGRAAGTAEARVVATSLAEPAEHALLQVLHEEIHPLTDGGVDAADRDTRRGTPGHAAHARLEAAALERGRSLLAVHAADLLPAYARWRARFGA